MGFFKKVCLMVKKQRNYFWSISREACHIETAFCPRKDPCRNLRKVKQMLLSAHVPNVCRARLARFFATSTELKVHRWKFFRFGAVFCHGHRVTGTKGYFSVSARIFATATGPNSDSASIKPLTNFSLKNLPMVPTVDTPDTPDTLDTLVVLLQDSKP